MKLRFNPRCSPRRVGLWSVLLAASALFYGVVGIEAQAHRFQAAGLTSALAFSPALEGLRDGLAPLGYQGGENTAFVIEDAQSDVPSPARRAASLGAAKADVMFTIRTEPTAAAKRATTTPPSVFAVVADPLRSAFITGYASSQDNLTGITNYAG